MRAVPPLPRPVEHSFASTQLAAQRSLRRNFLATLADMERDLGYAPTARCAVSGSGEVGKAGDVAAAAGSAAPLVSGPEATALTAADADADTVVEARVEESECEPYRVVLHGFDDGVRLPAWQAAPSRREVGACLETLRAFDAFLLFRSTELRRAALRWRRGARDGTIDSRPMVQRLKIALARWTHTALARATVSWSEGAARWAARRRRLRHALSCFDARMLSRGLMLMRLHRLRVLASRMEAMREYHERRVASAVLRGWRVLVVSRRRRLEETTLKTVVFRRWLLHLQTALLTRLLVRDQMAVISRELRH